MDQKKLFEQKTSRRTFLKQSAAALAAATLLPTTSVFAKEKVKIKIYKLNFLTFILIV